MTSANRLIQGISVAILGLLGLSLAGVGVHTLGLAALASLVSGTLMFAIDATAPRDRWKCIEVSHARPHERWRAQAFSFLFGGVALLAAGAISPSHLSDVVTVVLVSLLALSAFTPFCLGRLVYMMVFARRGPT